MVGGGRGAYTRRASFKLEGNSKQPLRAWGGGGVAQALHVCVLRITLGFKCCLGRMIPPLSFLLKNSASVLVNAKASNAPAHC